MAIPSSVVIEDWAILMGGSRDWKDPGPIAAAIDSYVERTTGELIIINGGQKTTIRDADGNIISEHGADHLVRTYCTQKHIDCLTMRAQWRKLGDAAGPIRNQHMINVLMELRASGYQVRVHAFPLPGSKGTWDLLRRAEAAGIDRRTHGKGD